MNTHCTISAETVPSLNYALYHNGLITIPRILITVGDEAPLSTLTLKITSEPAFIKPFTQLIDQLPPDQTTVISSPNVIVDGSFLAQTTERLNGVINISLEQNDETIAGCSKEIVIHAFDEWGGESSMPESLAAFVTPNNPELVRVISKASDYLGKWTKDTAFDEYQTQDPSRALYQAAALYTALMEEGIRYITPPASFEKRGQRVRLPDTVLNQKMGTCLDLTLLYASLLEAVGLNPILILVPGHIFSGVWLVEKTFPEAADKDPTIITKRLAGGINEIAVIETTKITEDGRIVFDSAASIGEANFTHCDDFTIIDVKRARRSGIRPLPQRVNGTVVIERETELSEEAKATPEKVISQIDTTPETDDGEEQYPKKVIWERKLLDLSMRNALLNLRWGRVQLPILSPSLDELENQLSDNSEFKILSKPQEFGVIENYETLCQCGTKKLISSEFENKRLRSALTETELERAVSNIYLAAKSALEENGANSLYLALGLLKWYETSKSVQPRYAPLVLIPIEMVRKSARQGYVIRLREDEPQINVTLIEKLKQDFEIEIAGLDPIPLDEHGIDLRKIFTIVRKAIMGETGWDIVEAATIGIFSFSQFVMWNDIRNRSDDLVRNKIVRSLMEGKLSWEAAPLELGERVQEDGVLLPMAADASQLHAIRTACEGKSFVLHGPPGTGKSQTITSLIANSLAAGKTVLFVAEKMAALEVVQRRLNKIGIGDFCLELHSNKSKKRDLLDQLRKATEATKKNTPKDFAVKADEISRVRATLDAYMEKLHKPLLCGSDLYALISEYESRRDATAIAPFERAVIKTLDKTAINDQRLLLEELVAAGMATGHPAHHPLSAIGRTQYSLSLPREAKEAIAKYLGVLEKSLPPAEKFAREIGSPMPLTSKEFANLCQTAVEFAKWRDFPEKWSEAHSDPALLGDIILMATHADAAETLRKELSAAYSEDFLKENGAELHKEYIDASTRWFLPKFFAVNKLAKRLRIYAKGKVIKENIRDEIRKLRDYQEEKGEYDKLCAVRKEEIRELISTADTDWKAVKRLAEEAKSVLAGLMTRLNGNAIAKLSGRGELSDTALALQNIRGEFADAEEGFANLLSIAPHISENWLLGEIELCRKIDENLDRLKEWTDYARAAAKAREAKLDNVISGYEAGLPHNQIIPAYNRSLTEGLIYDAIEENPELNEFSGAIFRTKIEQFKRLDSEWTRLSQEEIYCRIASRIPDFTREAAKNTELGMLQRAIHNNGRGLSIRRLFDMIPNLLVRLCPCMLMSPISAAQYLDPKRTPFDIVVFDEASQLQTCKAVGVLARGKEAVIVGDPKQMPPTSFFSVNSDDEENIEEEDLESILDDCLALNMPETHLLWHYRSRHESLIAFSNTRFYENKLFTFPSINDRESKVTLVKVDGIFTRGKDKTNRREAEAVIEELIRRSKDRELSKYSVGIVTFNIAQQKLIAKLLDEACAKDQELDKWAFASEEPVFIKNLENVQGDERDAILFSIGYGPDENGKVYMNFGPLNRDGGWRRLNVAVSRSRHEMVIFSSLRPEQFQLSRTRAEGVAALRAFIEYAEGMTHTLEECGEKTREEPDGIIRSIAKVLAEKGYQTEEKVGRSAYKVDLAVIDPDDKEKYILGIMCDGDSYQSSKTTRDREIAQTGVLEGLGWKLMRVWSIDWWTNRDREIERILSTLNRKFRVDATSKPDTSAI